MEETNMREVTVKEFVKAFEGDILEINANDTYGMYIQMSKARLEYDETMGELSFTAGNYNSTDGIGSVTYDVNIIESIMLDEDTGEYTISFTEYMPDITIKKFE